MSSGSRGSASALPAAPTNGTPAQADQWEADALAAIETVVTPEDAELLLGRVKVAEHAFAIGKLGAERERSWKALRLKAERRYGELLPPKQPGPKKGSQQPVTNSDERMAQSRARQVASVPRDTFDDYIKNDPAPSRQGLLRRSPRKPAGAKRQGAGKRKTKGEPTIVDETKVQNDPDVLAWVRRHTRQGWTTDRMIEASRAGDAGWPADTWPGGLSDSTISAVRTAIVHLERSEARAPARLAPKESGKRLRKLHDDKRTGVRAETDLWHLQVAVAKAVAVLEGFDLPDLDWSESTQDLVVEIHDDLERYVRWTDTALDAVVAHMDELGRRRKIQALDARANDASSTPNERATAALLAERLRGKDRTARLGRGA